MKYAIQYSPAALRDLDRVLEEVNSASKSTDVTGKYINDRLDKVEAKAEMPESGAPLYYGDTFTGYRFVVFKEYLVFYRIEQGNMYVDRILFRRSDYIRILCL